MTGAGVTASRSPGDGAGPVPEPRRREPLPAGGAWCELERWHFEAGDAGPATAIAKLPRPGPTLDIGKGLGLFERERWFYADLAARLPVRVPCCYQAGDGDAGSRPLVIEDLGHQRLGNQIEGLTRGDAEVLLDAMADLHAAFWESGELGRMPSLLSLDDAVNVAVMGQVAGGGIEALRAQYADRVDVDVLARAADVAGRFGDVLRAASDGPMTIAHGDLRLDNVFFADDGTPTLVDWQTVARTRGTHDVAYLLSGSMDADALRDSWEPLLRRYHDALRSRGVTGYDWDACVAHYRQNVLYSLLPPLALLGSVAIDTEEGRRLADVLTLRALRHADDVGAFDTV